MVVTPLLETKTLQFNSAWLSATVESAENIYVGFSGGVDSLVLLHALTDQLTIPQKSKLTAIHVHHGLSKNADSWLAFCESVCQRLGVGFLYERVVLASQASIEDAARKARYQVFESVLEEKDILLFGHHADDQLETLLFRLCRGTGGKGLAGIPYTRPLGKGTIVRPFLSVSKADLLAYAEQYHLNWVEDESNLDDIYARNFLRHKVTPILQERFPQVEKRAVSAAQRIATDYAMLERFASKQLSQWCDNSGGLRLVSLQSLPHDEKLFWLRQYLQRQSISLPAAQLDNLESMLFSAEDKQPEFCFPKGRIMRHLGVVYVLPEDRPAQLGCLPSHQTFERDVDTLTVHGDGSFSLRERPQSALLLMPNGQHRKLKKWLNDRKIPGWWREHLPYVFMGDELVAIGSLWRHPNYQGLKIEWHRKNRLPFPGMDD